MYRKQDRTSLWSRYQPDLCGSCIAACCKMPVEITREDIKMLGLVKEIDVLSDKKLAKLLQARKIIKSYRVSSGLFMVREKIDGACFFLENDRCSVYERRPQVCRKFPTEIGNRIGYCPYTKMN